MQALASDVNSCNAEVERKIAICKRNIKAVEETEQRCTTHCSASWAAMGYESKANSICLSEWFPRLTSSIVKAHLISQPSTLLSEFYLSFSEHSKLKSADNLSQNPSACRQPFDVCRDQENQPLQKSSFLIKHLFSWSETSFKVQDCTLLGILKKTTKKQGGEVFTFTQESTALRRAELTPSDQALPESSPPWHTKGSSTVQNHRPLSSIFEKELLHKQLHRLYKDHILYNLWHKQNSKLQFTSR